MNILYHPSEGRCGDFIPFFFKGEYHLFYIHGDPWEHISTTDFVHFKEHKTAIPSGGKDAQDRAIFTGSVIEKDGVVYIFYTGNNADYPSQGKCQSVVMLAKSEDCVNFEKQPAFLLPPAGDEFIDVIWRDPIVYYNEEESCYHMVLTASHKKNTFRRWAVSQLFKSRDLETWEKCDPVYAPYTYDTHECPDIFKMGDNWYLIFSTYAKTWETRYRISKSPYGPWNVPQNDTLGGKAYYAAKTVSNGEGRYLVGWTALKEGLKDDEKYHWGGCLTVHRVSAAEDGRLELSMVDAIEKAFDKTVENEYTVVTGEAAVENKNISFNNPSTFSLVKIGEVKEQFYISFKVKNQNVSKTYANNFGLLFFGNGENLENWYQVNIEANGNKLSIDRSSAFMFSSVYLNEEINTELGAEFTVKLMVENTCAVLYVNDSAALSFRCYDYKEGMIGFFAQDTAQAEIYDIQLKTY